MTHPETKISFFKRPPVIALLLLVLLAASWICYFLATFNLNDYRREVEQQLEAMLSMPVQIGQLHYNLYETNIALKIDGLEIGTEETRFQIKAPTVLLSLSWQGLLVQEVRFTELALHKPAIDIRRGSSPDQSGENTAGGKPLAGLAFLESIHISGLEIHDGILRSDQGFQEENLRISDIDGELSDIKLGATAQITLNGDLILAGQKHSSAWQLQGEISLPGNQDTSMLPEPQLSLDVKDVDLKAFSNNFADEMNGVSLEGIADLHLMVNGQVDEFAFQLGLTSKTISLLPVPDYKTPIRFRNLIAQGQFFSNMWGYTVDNLSLHVDESRLTGKVAYLTSIQPAELQAALQYCELSLAQLKGWIPEDIALSQKIKGQGTIKLDHAAFTVQLPDRISGTRLQFDSLKGEILNLAAANTEGHRLVLHSLPFEVRKSIWTIEKGAVQWGAQEFSITGKGTLPPEELTISQLDVSGVLRIADAIREWELMELPIDIYGDIPLNIHLEGGYDQLNLDIHGDLSDFNLSHATGMKIESRVGDSLNLHGTLTPKLFRLDHGALNWSLSKGHISGVYPLGDPEGLSIDALLTINDLKELAATIPLLKRMQLHGQADLSLELRGDPVESLPKMVLTLRDAGLTPTRFIAKLNKINGRVRVTPEGLLAERLQVHMGDSPFTVKAQLNDFANPVLNLNVEGPAVRARDVVFSSDTAMLRDIKGRLFIDRDGLVFDRVGVRLDGGTDASVSGTISFHEPYPVQLDITSGFAQIGEVVGLWSGSRKRTSTPPEVAPATQAGKKTTVTINAAVAKGDLYGMKFRKATGVIIPSHNRLIIHPLDFFVGEGYCNAQVIVDFPAGSPSELRISGHAEDVDALEVYRELLNQQNIVRGKLRGDFYLTGEIGSNYLPSSYGEFSIKINDGVLHQFQVLSKVFSLLNVSQIFALKLPDMDLNGMPFDNLSANFHLDKGILKSEDLKIMSEAMNQGYVGQVDLIKKEIDAKLQVHPLGTVDKIVSRIPLAGWLLTGDNKAFLTAYFSLTGKLDNVSVNAMPLDTLSDQTIGLLKRTLGLPFKLAEDPQILWGGDGSRE